MTPLDSALRAAQSDPGKESDFYNLLLSSDLFVPAREGPVIKDRRTAFLTVLKDGEEFIPVFDTIERLQTWIRRPVAYERLQAHVILEMLGKRIHLGLNPGTEFYKEFVPKEIAWLKEAIRSQEAAKHSIPNGAAMLVGSPAEIPRQLVERLIPCLKKSPEVTAAYLAQVAFSESKDIPHLMLVLCADETAKDLPQAIFKEIEVAIRGVLSEDQSIDILKYSDHEPLITIARNVEPFFRGR